jgi:serine/threonine protein kinase
VHRDLKPENVLVDTNYHPLISDFGSARLIPVERAVQMTLKIGTPLYQAPELLCGGNEKISFAADVYAFAMIFYELIVGKAPFYERKELQTVPEAQVSARVFDLVLAGERPNLNIPIVSDEQAHILRACWDPDPETRPTFDQIMENPDLLRVERELWDERSFDDYKVLMCQELAKVPGL